jgi:hypothetical protein
MQYLHRWTKGDEPDKWTIERLYSGLNFYRYLRVYLPNDNELLDRIHDIESVLIQRKQNLSLDNQTK